MEINYHNNDRNIYSLSFLVVLGSGNREGSPQGKLNNSLVEKRTTIKLISNCVLIILMKHCTCWAPKKGNLNNLRL